MKALHTKIAIGSPNDTHKMTPDYEAIIQRWADKHLGSAYTVMRGVGRWRNVSEDTIILDLYGERPKGFRDNLQELGDQLHQETLLVASHMADVELADGPDSWKIKDVTPQEMDDNLEAMVQMAKAITTLQNEVERMESGMEDMAPSEDYICAKCGAIEPWNFFWGEFFGKPFRCTQCGSTEYKEPANWASQRNRKG